MPVRKVRCGIYYPVSDGILTEHPEIINEIRDLDTLLYQSAPGPIRVDRTADRLGLKPDQLLRLLNIYVAGGILKRVRVYICPETRCDSIIELSDDDYRYACDLCDKYYSPGEAKIETAYLVIGQSVSFDAKDLGLSETPVTDTAREIGESQIDLEKYNPTTVLFIAGDRGGAQRNQVQIPREFEAIQSALRGSEYRDAICVATPILAASHQKLVEAYRHRPEILHFAGHGDNRSLSLISDQGLLVNQSPIIAEQLSAILLNFPEHIRLCVVNTCDSADVAKHLVDTHATDAAVGWPGKLSDADAIGFSGTFYGRLGDGLTLEKSFALAANSLTTQETPVLYPAKGVDTDLIFISTGVKK